MLSDINPSKIRDWLVLLGIASAAILWFTTMYGLPPRVEKLETRFSNLEKQIDRNDVKTDIILDDVKTLKSYILSIHGK